MTGVSRTVTDNDVSAFNHGGGAAKKTKNATHVGPQPVDGQLPLPFLPGCVTPREPLAVLAAELRLVAHGEDVEIEAVALLLLRRGPRARLPPAAVVAAMVMLERNGSNDVSRAAAAGVAAALVAAPQSAGDLRRARDDEEEDGGRGHDRPGYAGRGLGRRRRHR